MSTFSGKLKEIPSISVDRFDGINLKSSVFFLSHCHTDHMIGLQASEDLPGPLYASEISTLVLKHKYKNLKNIIPIHTGAPLEIEYTQESEIYKIVVTLIPAGHCPGSVMFLFEYKDERVLYTGDFRMSINSLRKVRNFKMNATDVLKFNTVYIDSTFLRKDYHQFPTQFESVAAICEIILKWISQSSKHLVLIKLPARYGLEYLCIEVAKRLKIKIHVNLSEYDVYKCIAEMDECFTTNPYETRVHACFPVMEQNIYALRCRQIYRKHDDILIIRPTAMFWAEWNNKKNITTNIVDNVIRICYSSHASFIEIEDMLLYLKPDRVELNVSPECRKERDAMQNVVNKILAKPESLSEAYTEQVCDEYIASKFGNIRMGLNLKMEKESESSDSENEPLDVPVKRIKT